jgi:hypothetical protein
VIGRGDHAIDARVDSALRLSAHALIGAGADMATSQAWVAPHLQLVAHIGFDDAFATYFHHVENEVSACGSVLATRSIVRVHDVEHDDVYDDGARQVMLAAGSRACISAPVIDRRRDAFIGVISAHFRVPGAPDRFEVQEIADLTARLAGSVRREPGDAVRRERDELREALATRAVIDQAKTVLMATTGCSAEDAFALLVQQSQDEYRTVRAVAADLVLRERRP